MLSSCEWFPLLLLLYLSLGSYTNEHTGAFLYYINEGRADFSGIGSDVAKNIAFDYNCGWQASGVSLKNEPFQSFVDRMVKIFC
jgi:hypothetical protein